jgi:HAD superfamily hydrolase (TIGR01509 family)
VIFDFSRDIDMSECHEIKAIIFDFFGTLVPNFSLHSHKAVLEEMATLVGAPPELFVERWFATFTERFTGKYPDVASNIRSICRDLGIEPDSGACKQAVELHFDYERRHIIPRPTAESTIRELRKRGYKIGLITDCSSELPALWGETVFSTLFDVTVFSCLAGMRKPDPAIYWLACKQLQVSSKHCVFVGDGGSKELTGAAAVEMHPVLLFDEDEQNNPDTHRIESEVWEGPMIDDLKDLIPYLEERRFGIIQRTKETSSAETQTPDFTNIAFYDRNADVFFRDTVDLDVSRLYQPFVELLPGNGHILDAGCGSGRDCRAFHALGYRVTAFDVSEEMVIRARRFSGVDVQKRTFEEVDEVDAYDGVWTCASLLHVPRANLPEVMSRLSRSLKANGVWYLSFKHGSGERFKDGRMFTDMDESTLRQLVASLDGLTVISLWSTTGGRAGQEDVWLNALLRKMTT